MSLGKRSLLPGMWRPVVVLGFKAVCKLPVILVGVQVGVYTDLHGLGGPSGRENFAVEV